MESYCNILHYLGGNGRTGVEYLSFIMEVFVNDHTSYSRSCTYVGNICCRNHAGKLLLVPAATAIACIARVI